MAPTRASYVSSTARVTTTARPSVPLAQRPVVARLTPATPVNRRVPQYTNDSKPFVEQSNHTNQTTATPNHPNETNTQGNQNNGFRPFTPPNQNNPNPPKNLNQNANTNNKNTTGEDNRPPAQNEVRPAVRYSAPVKAKDENYDVHPPLNTQKPPAPKPEEKPKPQPKPDKPHEDKPHSRG
jgi:hypothetical protein